jgi:UDP-glucose 4-epimerase
MTGTGEGKVVVIGGAGFIGSHIVEALCREDVAEIVVYDNFSRGGKENLAEAARDPRVRLVEGDITYVDVLNEAVKGATSVFHLAALWLLHCYEYPRAAFHVNVEGTFNVLEACVRNGVRRLVYSSSASVYGDAVAVPMTEDHPYNNRTFYGATKIAGEHMARAFHARYGLDYVGLRYMNVYGPRQDYRGAYTSVIMKVLDRLDAGLRPVVYGDGSQTYDFVYVADVARANVAAMRSRATDRFYNVGMGVGTSIKELVELLLEVTSVNADIEYQPEGPTFVTNRIGSTEKARRELGFTATTELRDGLRQLIEWRNRQPDTRSYRV